MTQRELSQNLLLAYIQIKAANESLKVIMEFKNKVDNKEFIELVKQVKPKLSYFVKVIDNTLLASPEFKTKHWEEIEEECFKSLDVIDQHIKTL
jgi:ABC-type sulfate transport system substrate-binding protein